MVNTITTLPPKGLLSAFLFSFSMLQAMAQPHIWPPCSDPNQPAFEECEDVNCVICNLNGYTGTSAGFGVDPDDDLQPHFCGLVESVQNVQFYAAVSNMSITVTVQNCNPTSGIDLGVMELFCDNFPLFECAHGNGTNSTTIVLNNLTIGNTYTLIIDIGATGDCDYGVSVSPPNGTVPYLPPNSTITGDFNVCPNATAVYHLAPPIVADMDWSVSPGAEIVSQSTDGNTIVVEWGDTGGEICLRATTPCTNEDLYLCHEVTMAPIPTTILPPVKVCPENAPYELPWGELATTSGVYSLTLNSFQLCDSVIEQSVTFLPANFHNLPAVEMCENGCLTKCGETFCGYGNYSVTCQSFQGCDSVINFSIIPPNLVADIQGGGSITCSNTTVTLTSAPSSGVKTWTNSAGQVLGTGSLLTVGSPGTYFLTVTLMLGGETCTQMDSVIIALHTLPPNVMANGTLLGCDSLPAFIHADSLTGPETYSWSGPGGFSSTLQNPTVTALGMYIVTVTELTYGCSAVDTVFVKTCCTIAAGTLDTTLAIVCGSKDLAAGFHWDQILGNGDSIAFILYSNPANPLGSILLYSDTTLFPFVVGLQQLDSLYYVAALVGPVLPDSTIDFNAACWSLSPAQPVKWVRKPSILLTQAPDAVCKGNCMDLAFQFMGIPPFQFHLNINQNGILLYSQDVVSDDLQKTITICPANLLQPTGSGPLNFTVGFFQDAYCRLQRLALLKVISLLVWIKKSRFLL